MNTTLQYYHDFSNEFFDRTVSLDMSDAYGDFLKHLSKNASILDAGCGSGRDAKYFMGHGYKVTAFDGSEAMVDLASQYLGQSVHHMTFEEMDWEGEFDGLWAQASLLHVPYEMMRSIFQKCHRALKTGGVFYASFKYGESEMTCDHGRYFSNMTEKTLLPYGEGLFQVINLRKREDTRQCAPSPDNAWIGAYLRKVD